MRERSFCRRTCGLDAPTRYAATALLMVVLATADSGVQCSEGGREEGGGQGRQGWGLQKTRGREELSGRCRRCEEGGRRQATDWAGKASVRGSWPGGAGRGGRAGGLHLWEASGGAYGCEVCAVGLGPSRSHLSSHDILTAQDTETHLLLAGEVPLSAVHPWPRGQACWASL